MFALHFETWTGPMAGMLDRDIRDLHLEPDSGLLVQAGSSGLVSYRLPASGPPVPVDTVIFPESLRVEPADRITSSSLPDGGSFLVMGDTGTGLWGHAMSETGDFGDVTQWKVTSPWQSGLTAVLAEETLVFAAGAAGPGITTLAWDDAGRLEAVGQTSGPVRAGDIAVLREISLGSGDFVIAADQEAGEISTWRVETGPGGLALVDSIGAPQGLGILPAITAMEVFELGGQVMAVVASASQTGGMGALSVLTLDGAGRLTVTDHLLDTLDTRFGQVHSLAVTEAGGRRYVAAGGGDDGVSLFVMMPDGRLQYLASQEDTDGMGLRNVSALALAGQQDAIQVIAAGQAEPGLTFLSLGMTAGESRLAADSGGILSGSDGDDALAGGRGADRIVGGEGNDILSDGAGRDTLTGGAGADIFTLRSDGETDHITDFDLTEDYLDLSGLRMFFDPRQLEIESTATGARVAWFGDILDLSSVSGDPLDSEDLRARVMTGPDRPLLLVPRRVTGEETPDHLQGHDGRDDMSGAGGNDTLDGLGGADTIRGGNGDDRIHAGPGDDLVMGGNGRDHIRLGTGDDRFVGTAQNDRYGQDTILADAGDDTVVGGGGNDMIQGHAGFDLLFGGIGDDRLFGGNGFDTLRAGDGDDLAVGGNGRDLVFLGRGNDIFHDNAQGGAIGSDTIRAGAGRDTIQGGNGADRAFGEGGADLLIGRLGADSLYGGDQDDTISAGAGDDLVAGGRGRDRVFLGPGDDLYSDMPQAGRFGQDRVWAGSGNDTLDAGGGDDILSGEAGADVFVFRPLPGHNRVTDFAPGIDQLQLLMPDTEVRNTTGGLLVDWGIGSVLLEGVVLSGIEVDEPTLSWEEAADWLV